MQYFHANATKVEIEKMGCASIKIPIVHPIKKVLIASNLIFQNSMVKHVFAAFS